ncbi:hypothetical protein EJB05_46922, partial [Eragrostis curvula]
MTRVHFTVETTAPQVLWAIRSRSERFGGLRPRPNVPDSSQRRPRFSFPSPTPPASSARRRPLHQCASPPSCPARRLTDPFLLRRHPASSDRRRPARATPHLLTYSPSTWRTAALRVRQQRMGIAADKAGLNVGHLDRSGMSSGFQFILVVFFSTSILLSKHICKILCLFNVYSAVNSRLASVDLWEEIIFRGQNARIKEAWALDKVMQAIGALAFGPVDPHEAVLSV